MLPYRPSGSFTFEVPGGCENPYLSCQRKAKLVNATAKVGSVFAKAAAADSIRDAAGVAMLRGNFNLEITTKEDVFLCR